MPNKETNQKDINAYFKKVYEKIEPCYFKVMEINIEYFTNKNQQENRLKLGQFYNELAKIKYQIRNVDLTSNTARTELTQLERQFKDFKKKLRLFLIKNNAAYFINNNKCLQKVEKSTNM